MRYLAINPLGERPVSWMRYGRLVDYQGKEGVEVMLKGKGNEQTIHIIALCSRTALQGSLNILFKGTSIRLYLIEHVHGRKGPSGKARRELKFMSN